MEFGNTLRTRFRAIRRRNTYGKHTPGAGILPEAAANGGSAGRICARIRGSARLAACAMRRSAAKDSALLRLRGTSVPGHRRVAPTVSTFARGRGRGVGLATRGRLSESPLQFRHLRGEGANQSGDHQIARFSLCSLRLCGKSPVIHGDAEARNFSARQPAPAQCLPRCRRYAQCRCTGGSSPA